MSKKNSLKSICYKNIDHVSWVKTILFTWFILLSVLISTTANADVFSPTGSNTNQKATYIKTVIPNQELQKLATVIAEIKRFYVKPVTDREIFDNAISGMLTGLDPHSEYLKQEDLDSLEMITVGHFGGIGVEIIPDQGLIKVISPIDDTPAAKAGIKAGDIIMQINNKLVKDMSLHDAIKLMRGPKDSKLTLTIIRKNVAKPLTFNLHRDIIKIQSVKEQILEAKFGYLRIAFFQENTANEVSKNILNLQKQAAGHLRGLIIDLRNNPGGLLESAVQVSDNFLDARKLGHDDIIVYTKGNNTDSANITARATAGELLPHIPLVVLINEGSASAAEVVAGALQDYKRAVVIGSTSFGKGSVQTLLPVDNDSAIKLTTALYYTPKGRSIQAKGIEPDVVINDIKLPDKTSNDNDEEITHISEASLVDHLQNGNNAKEDAPLPKQKNTNASTSMLPSNPTDLAHKDYQVYEALNILKALAITHHHS